MKPQQGFIQIPILIAIIFGFIVVGGAGYMGVQEYKKSSAKPDLENNSVDISLSTTTSPEADQTQTELNQLRKELEELKQTAVSPKGSITKVNTSAEKPRALNVTPSKGRLSNSEIIKKVKPAVVYIETKGGSGTGMILDSAGYILTNAHVVSGEATANIKLSDTRSFVATVVGRDEEIDLAILKVNETGLPFVKLGNSDSIEQGDEVFTLGYPFGLQGDVSFKEGTISRRLIESGASYFETSAEIHPGNSGGPMVNSSGEVVGINTATWGKSIKGISFGETIKLAIPINKAKDVIPSLKEGRVVLLPQVSKTAADSGGSCSEMKDALTQFTAKYDLVAQQSLSITGDYMDDGTKENPSSLDYDYPYNKMLAKRTSFYSKIEQLQVDTASLDTVLSGTELIEVKSNLNNGGNKFKEAFDLKLQSFKYVNKDAYVYLSSMPEIAPFIPGANLDSSKAAADDAYTKSKAALGYFSSAISKLGSLKKLYAEEIAKNGCQ